MLAVLTASTSITSGKDEDDFKLFSVCKIQSVSSESLDLSLRFKLPTLTQLSDLSLFHFFIMLLHSCPYSLECVGYPLYFSQTY